MKRSVVALLVTLGLAMPAAAASDGFSAYAGAWKGSGTVRPGGAEKVETARCRMTAKVSDDGRSMTQSGQCAVPGAKVDVGGSMTLNPDTRRVSGSWRDAHNGLSGSLSGALDANGGMKLTYIVARPQPGEPESFSIQFAPSGGGWRLVTSAPGRGVVADIRFAR